MILESHQGVQVIPVIRAREFQNQNLFLSATALKFNFSITTTSHPTQTTSDSAFVRRSQTSFESLVG